MTFPPIDSSVPEIRLRALSSIHSKLDKGLLSAADLLKDNFLARFVDFWFIRKDVLQGSKTALLLLRNILSFTEVQNACMDLGVRKILSQWRLHVGEKVLQNLVWEILEEKLPIPLRAANEADLISAIQFNSNSPEVISTTTSSSISSPRVLPMKSLPLRLLLPPSKADALEEPSTYSPVRQHYFKKVQFSQLDNSLTESEPTFPWISLSSIDLEHLRPHTDIAHHPDQMRELCQTFCSSLLIDFPPEVFLQRPDLIKTLIQVLDVTENISLKSHICESLNVYIHKLVNKLELSREFHSKAMSNLDHSCYYDEDDSMSDSKNNSIEDRLQAVTLKKECLSTVEFVWITFEASLSLWVLNDGDHSYRLLNSVYTLEIQLIKLLEFLNVDIHKKDGGRINEISRTISNIYTYHSSKMNFRFHRVAYLLLLRLCLKWWIFSSSLDLKVHNKLKHILKECIYDPTLYLSQPKFHSDVLLQLDDDSRKDFDIEVKPMLRSIHHAVTFLKGSLNQNDIINSARHSVISYPLHESHLYLIKFFQFCSDTGNPELHHPIIQLLKIKNSHLKTQIYLCLHSLVQNIMGISHALNKFDPCKKIYFLLSSHKVIEQVCKTIMNEDSSSSLKIACEEILLYLLKSEHILKKIWHQIVTTVLVPNIVYLECLSNPDTRLGKMILNALNPDSDLRTFSGLNKNQLLESNFRLLFHNSLNLRQAVQANIKVFVAQEENSCLKLPRFADIFESDISDSFIKRTKDILNFRNIVESNQKSIGEFIKVMETLFLSDDTCSLEIERSLSHLIVLLEDNLIHIKFIESGGFKKIVEIWENILKEDNLEYGGELLPIVLKVMKVLLVKNNSLRTSYCSKLLFKIIRSMFILHSPRFSQLDQTQLDLSTIAALLLFKHVYTVENAEYITLDHLIGKKFTLPFDYEAMDDGTNEFEESPENMKGFKLMKVYWNLCYEGLSFMCSSSQTKFSENFDNRLVLQEDERTMIAASFSKENLSNPSKLIYSQTPVAFLKEVDFMNSQKLIDDNEELISTDYDRIFKKFLTLVPNSRTDLKIYVKILNHFIQDYNNIDSNVSSWIDQLLKTDQTIFKLLLRESVKENPDYISMTTIVVISHFLKLFGHKHKFTLVIRGIINEKPLIHCPSLKWIFYLIENQVHHLNLLECCDVAKYIQVCIKSHTEKGYFKSGQLIVMLKTLQRIAEKTLDEGDFESIEIFGRMEWFIHLFTHKNFIVRSLTFQLISLIAFSELGADSLTRRLSDVVSIWEICLSALMNEKEALIVRDGSLKTLTNLLYTGHNMYYGPTIKENVSGVLIHGESALTSFLQRANFEEFVVGLLKSFGAIHRIKCEEVEDSCGVSRSNRLENHSFDLDMTPLFMGGLNLFLLSISLNDGNLLKTLDTFTAIDLSDRALESITSNFPLMDYVYYLDSLICIYIKHPVQTLSVEYLFIANSHLASTLFIRRKVAGEEVDHLTRNCFNWYLTILRNTKDTESVHKLANIFKKYEEGLLEATLQMLAHKSEDVLCDVLSWITVYMNLTHMMNNEEIDHDPYSHLKRDILNNVITIFHMMDQNVILRTEKLTLIVNYSLASICLHPISIGSQIRKRWVTSILRYLTKIKEGRLEIKSLIRLLNNLSHQSQESKILVFKGENISNILMKYLSYLDTLRLIITLCSGTDPSIIINGQLFNGIVNIASKYRSEEGIYALKILIIIAANSSEIRSMIYKSNFLTGENSKSSPILFEALDPKGFKKKRSKYLILTLDLLLTVTSFQDGQIYVPSKCQGVMDYLLLSLVRNRNDIVSIAILRNISFHSSNRARMLFCKNFLLILRDIFLNASTLNDSKLLEICFQIVWSICHNSLKAKGTLRNAGVTESIEDLFNRSKVHLKLNSSLICNVNKVLGI